MRIRLEKIHEAAKSRPAGYLETVMSRGTVDGDWLEMPDEDFHELRRQFRPALPSVPRMAANLAQAAVAEVKARISKSPQVSTTTIEERLRTCRECEHFIPAQNRCPLCGCYTAFKARLRSQRCPAGKW